MEKPRYEVGAAQPHTRTETMLKDLMKAEAKAHKLSDLISATNIEANKALERVRAEARAEGMREAAGIAENCVTQECCGSINIVPISETEYEHQCCGCPNVVPMYPCEVAAAILAAIPETRTEEAPKNLPRDSDKPLTKGPLGGDV